MKRKLIDLKSNRATLLDAAQAAIESGNKEDYTTQMDAATALNGEIGNIEQLLSEQDRFGAPPAPGSKGESKDMLENRAETLMNGGRITFNADETLSAFGMSRPSNSTTLGTGSLVQPTRAGTLIRDRLNPVSSIIDQVSVVDLTGCGALLEPYVKSEQVAQSGKVTTLAGTTRAATDPIFRYAKISPYEVNVTSFVDRNIANLSPVTYADKIRAMAMQSLRRQVATLIYNGDGQSSQEMFGIKTAFNTAGETIYSNLNVPASGLTPDTLMEMYFAYGGDDELGGSACLYLTKADLKCIGEFRGTNEKRRLFEITRDEHNPNTGVIKDGGYIIPYTLSSSLTSLRGSVAGSTALQTMLYGNPLAYELALFGSYSIRVDESYKAGDRMLTILGDVMVGGNLVVDNSFVVASVPVSD